MGIHIHYLHLYICHLQQCLMILQDNFYLKVYLLIFNMDIIHEFVPIQICGIKTNFINFYLQVRVNIFILKCSCQHTVTADYCLTKMGKIFDGINKSMKFPIISWFRYKVYEISWYIWMN